MHLDNVKESRSTMYQILFTMKTKSKSFCIRQARSTVWSLWGTTLQIGKKTGIWKLERSKRLVEQKILSPKASLVMMSSRSDSISPEELCPDVCYPHMLPVGMVRKQFKSVSVFWGRQSRHFLGLFLKREEQINDN